MSAPVIPRRYRYLGLSLLLLGPAPACNSSADGGADGGKDGGKDAAAPAASACGTVLGDSTYNAGTQVASLEYGGETRGFRVHVPPSAADATLPIPLVLMFHGGGGSGQQLELASSRMNAIADRETFIAVYPDGTGALRTWNGGGCCGAAVRKNADDVGFVAALLDHLEASLCIDPQRVFAAGMSNGAIFAHRLACELSTRVAAIGAVAGADMTSRCVPDRPVPIMHIHGTADAHVPWTGGEGCGPADVTFPAVETTLSGWRARNGCQEATAPYLEQGDTQCLAYANCNAGGDVVLCSVEGGGHNWPGGEPPADVIDCPADGPQSQSFSASEAIWAFFAGHPMR